ncbi:hypothetical protein BKH43_07070 [Helicobacter sp. 13S00401-1]|uniref:hypothetical protein n=1 Tax=Helicobacter sp. 13S00401-1 TaxID=1905758 RepID=UPI000BA5955B|nr:hypothetical protein [Helicobacter sp. 13S00401-1]PAF49280.1 hypothetical protein BKH43_07070 [Helicobacter sp. 13S00401-1]
MKSIILSIATAFILVACSQPLGSFSNISIESKTPESKILESKTSQADSKTLSFKYQCTLGSPGSLYKCQINALKATYDTLKDKGLTPANYKSTFNPKTNVLTVQVDVSKTQNDE